MLTDDEKAERKRQRMIETARQYTMSTYVSRFVAKVFQRMIRAVAAADPSADAVAIVDGNLKYVPRNAGECVCVTCGKVEQWSSGLGGMHTGHFLGSRCFSILFEEANVAAQCSRCNRYLGGAPQEFRRWMLEVRGEQAIERLEQLKATTRQFTREELVDMRIDYEARLKAAIERMKENTDGFNDKSDC